MIEIHALEGAHFRLPEAFVPPGEMAAIVAPNAACAREFVDLLLGLAEPRAGTVRLFGQLLGELDEAEKLALRTRLGYAAQLDGLIGHLAMLDNVVLSAQYHHRLDAASLEARMRTLLGWCGWREDEARQALLRRPEHASPFECAAAAWLRAVLCGPALLVCEDLFGGLAPEQRRHLINASVAFLAEEPERASVFVLVGDGLVEELQPTSMYYLTKRGDFRAESHP